MQEKDSYKVRSGHSSGNGQIVKIHVLAIAMKEVKEFHQRTCSDNFA